MTTVFGLHFARNGFGQTVNFQQGFVVNDATLFLVLGLVVLVVMMVIIPSHEYILSLVPHVASLFLLLGFLPFGATSPFGEQILCGGGNFTRVSLDPVSVRASDCEILTRVSWYLCVREIVICPCVSHKF